MRVLVVEPKKAPYVKEVGEELPDLQKEVGGFIEAVYPFEDDAAIICNEEGKQKNLELNRALFDRDGEVYDIIAGTFLITGTREDSFGSLSPEQIDRYSRRYETPETFLFEGNRIRVKKELPRAERNEQRFFKNGCSPTTPIAISSTPTTSSTASSSTRWAAAACSPLTTARR